MTVNLCGLAGCGISSDYVLFVCVVGAVSEDVCFGASDTQTELFFLYNSTIK